MNPKMVLYLTINQVDSCHGCICGTLSGDAKDILLMDHFILVIIYKSLAV